MEIKSTTSRFLSRQRRRQRRSLQRQPQHPERCAIGTGHQGCRICGIRFANGKFLEEPVMSAPTLEQRIAAALADNDIDSSALATLIAETAEAVEVADKQAIAAREQALDPIASPDPNKARASMEAAAFTRDRLRTVLPRLQQRLKEVCSQEEYAHWVAQYEAIKIKRDAAAAELRTIYPEFASKLVDLLLRIEVVDREVARVGSAKPFDAKEANGDGRWLVQTELAARGLNHFTVHDQQIM